jgi:hypothetical protein
MKRRIPVVAITVLALVLLGVSGCRASTKPKSDDMGVWGYVVAAKNAQLEVAPEQPGVDTLLVDRVLAPEDAWLVVHLEVDGKPGMRVGLAQIAKGESTNVEIPLEGVTTPNVIVAIHADRGTPGTFDFDMAKATSSFDRPFFVDEKELARVVAVR